MTPAAIREHERDLKYRDKFPVDTWRHLIKDTCQAQDCTRTFYHQTDKQRERRYWQFGNICDTCSALATINGKLHYKENLKFIKQLRKENDS